MWKWIIGAAVGVSLAGIAAVARAASRGPSRGAAGNVSVRGRTIYGPGGFTYRITDEDLLWLARAVWGEAGERASTNSAAVAWAMVQYYALVLGPRGTRPAFPTLTALLRAYCQPINPKWATLESSGCVSRPHHCSDAHLIRRRQITNAPWGSIPEGPRRVVLALASGELPNPVPGMTDWAAENWQARSSVPLVNIGGNKFGVGRSRRLYREA